MPSSPPHPHPSATSFGPCIQIADVNCLSPNLLPTFHSSQVLILTERNLKTAGSSTVEITLRLSVSVVEKFIEMLITLPLSHLVLSSLI